METREGETCRPAYAISGTVTGLAGSGLVLHNGADDLVVTAAGPFFFSTALVAGQSYDVTVQSQPSAPAQHCTVANGSGTAGTNDPSKVTVSCSASTGYTIGGTVTGLTGSGLILDVNVSGAQPLASVPVSTAGTFAFPTEFGQGATYVVAVEHQPAVACAAVHRHRPSWRHGRDCQCHRCVGRMCKRGAFRLCRKRRRRHHFLVRHRSDDRGTLRPSECPWPRVRRRTG